MKEATEKGEEMQYGQRSQAPRGAVRLLKKMDSVQVRLIKSVQSPGHSQLCSALFKNNILFSKGKKKTFLIVSGFCAGPNVKPQGRKPAS